MTLVTASKREGKYLLYWLTTTSVVTTYSYIATVTLASLHCTPSNYVMTTCTA